MPEQHSAEKDTLTEAVADLRLWMDGERSMTNYIVGSLGGHEGGSEIERRLIWEADTAQIVARAAILNAEVARVTPPAARGFGLLREGSPESDLSPITGGPDLETECVTPPGSPEATP